MNREDIKHGCGIFPPDYFKQCPYCGQEIINRQFGNDSLEYCSDCERITEGLRDALVDIARSLK